MKNNDLTISVEDYKLNIRSAGIMVHDGKILLHKNVNEDHYALVGGRVEIGEDSVTTLKREIMEEMGKAIDITGYISTVESFFEFRNSKYHEIMFVHQMEFSDDEDKKILSTLKNIEGNESVQYEWVDMSKLNEYKVLPEVIKDVLNENKFPIHKINNEMIY